MSAVDELEPASNSNVVFYPSPVSEDNIVKVDPDNIRFVMHRRGFITCVCGKTVREHVCCLQNVYKDLKIKFSMCPKKETCRYCEDMVQWNYERYMTNEDGKMCCRQCTKEIPSDWGICHDCFCLICYAFLNDCVCCKFCPPNIQCMCIDNNPSTDTEEIV